MNTATGMRQEQDTRDQAMFENMLEHFFKTWAPSDEYDRSRFHAEFYGLIRRLYRDAQEPFLNRLADLYARVPMFPMILPKDGSNG